MSINSTEIKSITDVQHVLCRKNMYLGGDELLSEKMIIRQDDKFILAQQQYQQSTQKLFDEIIQNSIDNYIKHPVKYYQIEIECKERQFSVKNNGYTFELNENYQDVARIFSTLRTSDQYGQKERLTSGMNGLGAKLVRLCSKLFQIRVQNNKKQYVAQWQDCYSTDTFKQTFQENEIEESYFKTLVKLADRHTQIEFDDIKVELDFNDFNILLIEKYVINLQLVYPNIQFIFNGQEVPKLSLEEFMQMHGVQNFVSQVHQQLQIVLFNNTQDCLFKHFTLINGIQTSSVGSHYTSLRNSVKRQCDITGRLDLGIMFIGQYEGLNFSEQIKTIITNQFDIVLLPKSIQFIKDITQNIKKDKKPKFIEKLREANYMEQSCSLIITEGDSASCLFKNIQKTQHDFFDNYGLFPLKGKILSAKKIPDNPLMCDNDEVKNLIQIIGLKDVTYTSLDQLRYQKVIIASDYDTDGFHICGLFISFIYQFWPELIDLGFLQRFTTPIIMAKCQGKQLEFFSEQQFKEDNRKFTQVQYFKGLGSFDEQQTKQIGINFQKYIKDIKGSDDNSIIWQLFIAKPEFRKALVEQYEPKQIDFSKDCVEIQECMQQVIEYSIDSLQRAIPDFVDGLKESQKKIIYWMLNHKTMQNKMKVSILASSVSSELDYHHGETSLHEAIQKLAQDFTGTNNCNLLEPKGAFGNRLDPKALGSPRYTYVLPSKWLSKLFNDDDKLIYKYKLSDDREQIEPEHLFPIVPIQMINGADGIATAWSTKMFCYSLNDVVAYIKAYLNKQKLPIMCPKYDGYSGTIKLVVEDNKTFMECEGSYRYEMVTEDKGDLFIQDTVITSSIAKLEAFLIENKIQHKKNELVVINNIENTMVAKIIAKFLQTKQQMTNMTFMQNEDVRQYSEINEFLNEWIDLRLFYYKQRKQAMLLKIVKQYMVQFNYKRFLDDGLQKHLGNIDEHIQYFTPMCEIEHNKNSNLYQIIQLLKEQYNHVQISDHNYLLEKSIKFYDKYDTTQIEKIKKQYDEYARIEPKQLWLNDLANIFE